MSGTTEQIALRCGPITVEEHGDGLYAVIVRAIGQVFVTNDVGKYVLELCDGLLTREQIITTISRRYSGISTERVRKDINRFLTAVTNRGIVTWTE